MASSDLGAPFVGRSRELDELERLLAESQLVTVVGAPGAGKTRFAFEAVRHLSMRYSGGVYTCELASIAAPELVEAAVSTALGFAPELRVELGAAARDRFRESPVLLLLDNCEHVRVAASLALRSLLSAIPGLRVLATSRERLGTPGETAWILPSLKPEAALQLLCMRAAAMDARFGVTRENRGALMEICERLDRLPLALELVATRLALLPAEEVARMLDDALGLLSGRKGPSRHRTMSAALDWSVALLPTNSADDFRRLAVFPSTFNLEAAATVLQAPPIAALDRLAVLRDASLLVADTSGVSSSFRLLEPVRQYASASLATGPNEEQVRRLHALYVLARAEWIGARLLGTPQQADALAAFAKLLPDIRQAVAWSQRVEPEWAARIVGHTGWAWEITSRLGEGEALMRSTLEAANDPLDRARLYLRLISIIARRSDAEPSTMVPDAIAAARNAGDTRELGLTLSFVSALMPSEDGLKQLDTVAQIAAETGDELVHSWERFMRAYICHDADDLDAARSCYETAVAIASALGDRWIATQATSNLVSVCLGLDDIETARRHLLSMLPTLTEHSEWVATPSLLLGAADLACRQGRPADGVRLLAAQRRLRNEIGAAHVDTTAIEVAARRRLHDPSKEQSYLAQGQRLSLPEALALSRSVLRETGPETETAASGPGRLTERELEVAQLIEKGLTNREIAKRLFITERTAEGHVERIRNKLRFRSRSQIAAWVVRQRVALSKGPEKS